MKRNPWTTMLAWSICLGMPISVSASREEPYDAGSKLIIESQVSGSDGSHSVMVNTLTKSDREMERIGLAYVDIQRSSDLNTWITEVELGAVWMENSVSCEISDRLVPVHGGYYYRVSVTHYAKSQGRLFSDSERIVDFSEPVWVG